MSLARIAAEMGRRRARDVVAEGTLGGGQGAEVLHGTLSCGPAAGVGR